MSGYVYVIGARSLARVKIGFTAGSPYERMRALQTGSAEPLEMLAIVRGAPALERSLHQTFAKARVHGEWFTFSPELHAFLLGIRLADPGSRDDIAPAATPLGFSFEELDAIALAVVELRREDDATQSADPH